jgi:hypothetical protein
MASSSAPKAIGSQIAILSRPISMFSVLVAVLVASAQQRPAEEGHSCQVSKPKMPSSITSAYQ